MLRLLSFLRAPRATARPLTSRRPAPAAPRFRPAVESMEDRLVLSANALAPPLGPALVSSVHASRAAASILPITVNNVVINNGALVANAIIGATNFQLPLTLSVPAGQDPAAATQILNLHLGPIHLNLLGLKVDTSEICLNISAQPGSGNLLGNLLAGIAGSLDRGLPLDQILGGLSPADLGTVTSGLTGLLNGGLGQLTSVGNAAAGGASVSSTGTTNILHLAVGPLNLNLLGLEVNLDNCHNGPVTVDITAQSGPGNLLGNLLGGLSHFLDSNASTTALTNRLSRVADRIGALV
jgi:hypothetical protein